MELELNRTQLTGYDTVLDTTLLHEETMEMIVPDACPDILRIVDTEARVCLSGKDALEGRAEISGSIKAAVLYLPDGEEGMRRLEVCIPFSCAVDSARLEARCSLVVLPRVQAAETRSINPRKVLVRANLAVCVRAYAPMTDSICSGLESDGEAGLEQLKEEMTTYVVACVEEKPFTFSDDLTLSGSKPEAQELLKQRLSILCSESKVIGNKLIFKGEAALQLLYRSVENTLCAADFTLPFSQIMEVSGAGEEADCALEIVPTSAECTLSPADGRTLSVSLGLLAQAVIREERCVELLSDIYSTLCPLEVDRRSYEMSRLLEHSVKSQSVREIVETGVLARSVTDAYLCVGQILQEREGGRLTITAEAGVTVLYEGEEGGPGAVRRQIPVSCQVELPEGCTCSCLCRSPEPVFATPTSGGLEVRFQLEFHYLALSGSAVSGVSDLRADEDAPREAGAQPSIVLRMVGEQERLWDIAKAYGTTRRDIIQANELEGESIPRGQLLLIPRKR